MRTHHPRLLLVVNVLLWMVVGFAEHAMAVTFTEFPVPTVDAGPWAITAGPDGALWFTESFANKIGRITTAGVITEFNIPTANSQLLGGITQGPDGAVWFSEEIGNKIGRITTAGVLTEFPVTGGPTGITTGPDGALWFTEADNKIGRITTDGVTTQFPIRTGFNGPGITTGPDGALWFTENSANKIGRITTAGVLTEFPMPTPGFRDIRSITTGPDGALWFTEINGAIGRITTAGVITEFPIIPTFGSVVEYITTGPDGALWFTDTFANKIGRITTAGVITEFPLPKAGSGPTGIATGPDGALWFTEQTPNADRIGRLSLPALQVSPSANIAASGPQGGPFSPVSFAYQLSSTTDSVNFVISGIPTWLNANFTSGVATTTPVTVIFSLTNLGSFVPGTYTATIAFTNTSTGFGNTTRTAALTVTPNVSSQIADLTALIGSFNLPKGIVNSLDAKLDAALATFNAMKTNSIGTACNQLGAFFNEVAAQSGNKVTDTQANQLISAGNQIKVGLGCL